MIVEQIAVPFWSTKDTPYVLTPTPFTIAVIIEPANDPTFGERDKNYGVKTIPLFTVRSSVPSGIPIGR